MLSQHRIGDKRTDFRVAHTPKQKGFSPEISLRFFCAYASSHDCCLFANTPIFGRGLIRSRDVSAGDKVDLHQKRRLLHGRVKTVVKDYRMFVRVF